MSYVPTVYNTHSRYMFVVTQAGGSKLFDTELVLRLALKHDIRALTTLARQIFKIVDANPNDYYEPRLPTWSSRKHPRGLTGWGESRKIDKETGKMQLVTKKGSVPQLCRGPILKALDVYWETVGLPPVNAGESMKKAIKEGRWDPDSNPPICRAGHTRKQIRLIPLQPPAGPVELYEMFLLVVGAGYCKYIDPPVEDGTISSMAVLGFLKTKKVAIKLLANIKTKINRITNKTLLCNCSRGLYNWVREGDVETRLKFVRTLADPGDLEFPIKGEPIEDSTQLMKSMAFQVVSTLVLVAQGRNSSGSNNYGFYPFGKAASFSTDAFLKLPQSYFASVLAEMYPYVARDSTKHKLMLKKCDHPMTGLWPWGKVNRHLTFRARLRACQTELFDAYEEVGGGYNGPEDGRYLVGNKKKGPATVSSDEDEDSMEFD